jgi:hypothetical protein
MPTFTAKDKLDAARRELKYRHYVYPRRVQIKKMTEQEAAWEIAVMEAIVTDYTELARKDELPL